MAINICKENKLYGFTLIELLAVILILGIIALIAISTVNNVLDEARQRSLSATINSVEKAVSSECEVELLKEKDFTNKYTITDGVISPKLDIKGNLPKNGFIEVSSKCEVKIYAHDGKYCANKNSIIFNIDKQEKNDCIPVVPNDNCFYFSNGVITNYKDSCPKSIIIPDTINEEKVIEIASNAFSKNDLTNVTIPLTVTKIGSYAFQLNKLNNIIIPSSVQHIGAFAFFKNKLKVIKVPDLMNNIESGAFNNNQLPDDQAFIYARNADGTVNKSTIVSYAGGKKENVIIPNTVKNLKQDSFRSNDLESVVIPDSVIYINHYVFLNNKLTNIEIGKNVKLIAGGAFNDNLLPDDQAFIYARNADGTVNKSTIVSYGGAKKENVIIPDGVSTLASLSFIFANVESIKFPASVKSIGSNAFRNNKLNTLTIPNTVTYIAPLAFNDNLLPDDQAFIYARNADGTVNKSTIVSYGGSNRQNVTIPDNVVTIGDSAFYGTSLWNITIPSSVETIGAEAFVWGYLKSITIPASVKSIGNWAFGGNSITTINMPGRTFNDLGTDWYTGRPTFNFD